MCSEFLRILVLYLPQFSLGTPNYIELLSSYFGNRVRVQSRLMFYFFEKTPAASDEWRASALVPGFTFRPTDYIKTPMFRDFFYITRRATSPS